MLSAPQADLCQAIEELQPAIGRSHLHEMPMTKSRFDRLPVATVPPRPTHQFLPLLGDLVEVVYLRSTVVQETPIHLAVVGGSDGRAQGALPVKGIR